jgi:hypothetical protein
VKGWPPEAAQWRPRNPNEYIWVFKCADGRIVRMEEHLDTGRFQQIVLDP